MNRITKVYLKLFLLHGLLFGFIMSLWDYIDEGEINLWKTAFMIIFFGGFMSWTTVSSMKKSKRKFGGDELTEEDFKVHQSEIISKNKSNTEIFDLLNSDELTKNWKFKFEEQKITGKTKVSWSSWGERITISDLNDKIKIESKPVLKITMFDNGKNKENITLIKKLIEE